MPRLLALALVLALAGPALAAPSGVARGRLIVPSAPVPATLRGALSPTAPAGAPDRSLAEPSQTSAAERLFLAPATLAAASGQSPQACRLACAQTYYFCAQSEYSDECPPHWALCRSACDAPNPAQSFAPH